MLFAEASRRGTGTWSTNCWPPAHRATEQGDLTGAIAGARRARGCAGTHRAGSGVGAEAAARWSGALARSRNRALSAAKVACRRLAPRRYAGMSSRMVFRVMLLEGMDMREDTD